MSSLVQRLSFRRMIPEILLQRKTNNAQNSLQQQSSLLQRSKNDNRASWRDYWVQTGQP